MIDIKSENTSCMNYDAHKPTNDNTITFTHGDVHYQMGTKFTKNVT